MSALLFEPHADDAALFAAFTCQRLHPHVVSLLADTNGRRGQREAENDRAMDFLRCRWQPEGIDAADPDWDAVRAVMERGRDHYAGRDVQVFAPFPEPGGHPQHNRVGELAREVFGRVTFYTTYRYGGPKTRPTRQNGAVEVPFDGAMVMGKLRALACYRSQIEVDTESPRRFFLEDLYEYVVVP